MKIRLSTILIFILAFAAGAALLWTSQQVQTEERTLRQLNRAIAAEVDAVRVLRAEWAFLNRPDRLEEMAKDLLQMYPPQPGQIHASPASLPEPFIPALPSRKPAISATQASLSLAPVPAPSSPDPDPVTPSRQADNASFEALLRQLEEEVP